MTITLLSVLFLCLCAVTATAQQGLRGKALESTAQDTSFLRRLFVQLPNVCRYQSRFCNNKEDTLKATYDRYQNLHSGNFLTADDSTVKAESSSSLSDFQVINTGGEHVFLVHVVTGRRLYQNQGNGQLGLVEQTDRELEYFDRHWFRERTDCPGDDVCVLLVNRASGQRIFSSSDGRFGMYGDRLYPDQKWILSTVEA